MFHIIKNQPVEKKDAAAASFRERKNRAVRQHVRSRQKTDRKQIARHFKIGLLGMNLLDKGKKVVPNRTPQPDIRLCA